MHTLALRQGWFADVNGDFSGDVGLRTEDGTVSVHVPYMVLQAIVAERVRRHRVREMQTAPDEVILGVEE